LKKLAFFDKAKEVTYDGGMLPNSLKTPLVRIEAMGANPKKPWIEARGGRVMKDFTLLYLVKGNGFFEDSLTKRTAFKSGDVAYLYPGRWHCYDPLLDTTWTEYWVSFDAGMAEKHFGNLFPGPHPHYSVGLDSRILNSFETMLMLWNSRSVGYEELLHYYLHYILIQFFIKVKNIKVRRTKTLASQIKDHLEKNLSDSKANLPCYCDERGIDYHQMRREFKKESGLSPGTFLKIVRMNRAKEMLLHTDATISRIAESCGFEDFNFFSRFFKKEAGISPREFRLHHRPLSHRGSKVLQASKI
jgi:AraC-like DNA-binding protein